MAPVHATLDPFRMPPASRHGVGVVQLGQTPSHRHPRTPLARRADLLRQTPPRLTFQSIPAFDEARPHRVEMDIRDEPREIIPFFHRFGFVAVPKETALEPVPAV
jgi:hypothetical protein